MMSEIKRIRLSRSGDRKTPKVNPNSIEFNKISSEFEPAGNGIYFATKIEFIENWLTKHTNNNLNNDDNNGNSFSTPSINRSNLPSSPQKNILLRSPLKDTNQVDFRASGLVFRNNNLSDRISNDKEINQTKVSPKLTIFKENHDFISKTPTRTFNVSRTLNVKKFIESSFTEDVAAIEDDADDDDNHFINKKSLSPSSKSSPPQVESIRSLSMEKDDIESITSSAPQVAIDNESDASDAVKIDEVHFSAATNEKIQNFDEQSSVSSGDCLTRNTDKIEDVPDLNSSDSNKTYFSGASQVQRIANIENSQKISNISDVSEVQKDPDSPSAKRSELMNYITMVHASKKKKRKPKKGTLAAKLHTLITGQVSYVHLWRHQMAQNHLKSASPEYFIFQIQQSVFKYGRHFVNGLAINDDFNLLNNFTNNSNPNQQMQGDKNRSIQNLTVVLIPDIVGSVNIVKDNLLKIYPPWEVISLRESILYVSYFHKYDNSSLIVSINTPKKRNKIINNYNCPCLTSNEINKLCQSKFHTNESNPLEYIFNN